MTGTLHVIKYTLEKIRSGAVSRLVNTGDQRPRLTLSSVAVERVKEYWCTLTVLAFVPPIMYTSTSHS